MTLPFEDGTIAVATYVALVDYLRTVNKVASELELEGDGKTVMVYTGTDRLTTLFGSSPLKPVEVVTDGAITEPETFDSRHLLPDATYTGWTASGRMDNLPFNFFIITKTGIDDVRRAGRTAEANHLSLVTSKTHSDHGIHLREPQPYPFR